ncbi:phage tail protein [Ruminococcus flavefaciens]|uniref:phage tail protein n=1 Tax=Ruminococcus flavefaciens TaxID=1265 RepID=UPI00048A7F7E|nr:hypothetical protein [Ruminococcus flavefaciens]
MNVYKLEAAIGLNTTEYLKGLKSAGESMSTMGDKIKAGAAAISKAAVASFGAIAGAATATTAAVLKGVDAYTTFGDNIDKMSQKMGLSAQAYQEWSAIMEHSGTSIDSMQASMKTLASAAETGNDAFEKLGLTQEAIANMSQEQLFSATIKALQNVDSETERTYLAGQLLGRGATELGALLNTSAEETERMKQRVHELGGVMSDEAVKASARYKDSIQDMKTAFKGMGRDLISDFVPALTTVSDGLAAIFSGDENGANIFAKGFDAAIGNIGKSAAKIKPIARKIGSVAVKALPEILSTVGKGLVNALPSIASSVGNLIGSMFDKFQEMDLGAFNWLRDDISDIVGSVRRLFGKIDFEGLKTKLSNVGGAISGIFDRVGDAATWVFDNALSPLIEWATNSNFLDGIAAGFNLIGDAVDFLKTPAIAVWEGFLQPILSTTADVWDVAAGGLKKLANGLNGIDWEGYWIDMFDGHFGEDWKLGWQSIYDAFAQGGEAIDDFFSVNKYAQGWNEFWQGVGEHVFNVKTGIVNAMKEIEDAMARIFGDPEKEAAKEWNVGDTITDDKGREFLMYNADGTRTAAYNAYIRQQAENQFETWKSFDIEEYRKANGIPAYAEGGRVTRPTFALIGEKEPETIIPDSKRSEFGNITNIEKIEVVVNGAEKNGSEIAEEFIEQLSRKFSELSVKQQRAVGGVGW